MVNLNIGNDGRTGLGYAKRRFLFLYVLYIRKNGKFRAKAYVKNRLHPPGFQIAVQVKVQARKIGSYRRGNNGNNLFVFAKVAEKARRIVQSGPRVVGTGMNTVSTADAEIMVDGYFFSGAVVTVLYRTRRNTGMTVDAFFFVNCDNRR
jgi:hypothetical protein